LKDLKLVETCLSISIKTLKEEIEKFSKDELQKKNFEDILNDLQSLKISFENLLKRI